MKGIHRIENLQGVVGGAWSVLDSSGQSVFTGTHKDAEAFIDANPGDTLVHVHLTKRRGVK